ncbi:EcoKI restriction-modification system protein HsdS [uncultured Clostridium sp.]|uniref:restriction endonuclease subunit S n=1 Tax=uncultured Clostridium sp. TaxID=59620 RepID=UPI000820C6B3|nr:restriction endonuclease subunit S [uncultured Clostridium sp.]SCJ97215.1 EcoKI restriction-modification system protein HsdS [uncultured Clostridium sp.]
MKYKEGYKNTVLGYIPIDWEIKKVDDIKADTKNSIAMGPFGSRIKSDNFVSTGVPVIRGINISEDIFLENEFVYLTEEKAKELSSSAVGRGDIVFTHRGTLGQVGIIPDNSRYDKYIVSQSQMKLVCNKEIVLPEWVYYYFKSPIGKYQLLANTSTTGVPAIGRPTSTLKEINIPIPSIEEQQKRVDILECLNRKIQLNNEMNKTLEEMAQALFKRWFVDFEFPNEDGKPYKSSGGEMVESELGMIPKGWIIKMIDEISNVNIGKTPPRKEHQWFSDNDNKNDIRWISIKDLGNSGAYINKTTERLTEEAVNKFNVKIIPDNTVVLSFKLTIGRVAITVGKMLSNEAIAHFVIDDNSKVISEYIYLYLKIFKYEMLGSTSSIATAINSKIVKTIPIIIPEEDIMKNFKKIIGVLFKQIKENSLEIESLIDLRDSLLPKLMSGEIRVEDVEANL